MQYLSLTNRAPDNQLISAMLPMGEKNIYVLIPQAGIEKYEEIHQYIQMNGLPLPGKKIRRT